MMKLLEEFDGEPMFTLENEIIYQELQTTGAAGLAISKPKMSGEDVRRSALELIQAHGGQAFKFAAKRSRLACALGDHEVQHIGRQVGCAVLEFRARSHRGPSFNLVA